MTKLGLLGKLPEKEEFRVVTKLYDDISQAYTDMFLPTVLFDRKNVMNRMKRAKKNLKRLV